MTDPNPCSVIGCIYLTEPVERCEQERCPYRWQREGREDRAERERKDAVRPALDARGRPGVTRT
jgi:hypothetical protein